MSKGTEEWSMFLLDQAHLFGLNLEDTEEGLVQVKRLGIEPEVPHRNVGSTVVSHKV